MSNALIGKNLYPFVGLSTDAASPTSDSTASAWATKPIVGQRARETDINKTSEWDGVKWVSPPFSASSRGSLSSTSADIVDGNVNQDVTGTSQSYALTDLGVAAGDTIRIASEENLWVAWGTSVAIAAQQSAVGVENDSFLLFAGTYEYIVPATVTHIAWLGDTATSGTVCFSKVK